MDVYARNNIKIVGAADGRLLFLAHGFGSGVEDDVAALALGVPSA